MAGLQAKKGPCFLWQKTGRCKFGDQCKFTHGKSDKKPSPPQPSQPTHSAPLQQWRSRFSKQGKALEHDELAKFFQECLCILSGGGRKLMQEAVDLLTSDSGLASIDELIRHAPKSTEKKTFVSDCLLPFFKCVAHPDIDASQFLKKKIVRIYDVIYGLDGRHAVAMFELLAKYFDTIECSQGKSKAQFQSVYEVFTHVILKNDISRNNSSLAAVAETLVEKAIKTYNPSQWSNAPKMRRLTHELSRDLNIGKDVASADSALPRARENKAKFVHGQGLPGGRHDNDHMDISAIQIMPTCDEVNSQYTEYLPIHGRQDTGLNAFEELIDRHFRLLREDTAGQIRDAIHAALHTNAGGARQLPNGPRMYSYRNLRIVDVFFLRGSGVEVFVKVDQPVSIKGAGERHDWWEQSKRLQKQALVCITGVGKSYIYCTVSNQGRPQQVELDRRWSPEDPAQNTRLQYYNHLNLFSQQDGAYFSLRPLEDSNNELGLLLREACDIKNLGLVEFPGVLVPGFQPTLLALQKMLKTRDMPFTKAITAQNEHDISMEVPRYARAPDFQFDLGILTGSKSSLKFSPHRPFDANSLVAKSTLDGPQAEALLHCLSTSLSLIQGPPGTGKSFTGVALIRVLLAIKKKANLGPILCVCYTNHALDQLLEHLHESGVTNMIRVGSQSKSATLADINLREVARGAPKSKEEKSKRSELYRKSDGCVRQASQLLDNAFKAHYVRHVREFLRKHNARHYRQLFAEDEQESSWQKVEGKKSDPLRKWVRKGIAAEKEVNPRSAEQLQQVHLDDATSAERNILLESWISGSQRATVDKVLTITQSYQKNQKEHQKIHDSIDIRCLQDADVIGLTTSGLARKAELLRKLRAKVLLCEEAGEVLEAHILTALLPNLEHVILIGDHQQLRPQVQNYELSRENPQGVKYSLDISLFERLVQDPHGLQPSIPYRTLEVQRRMHPSISRLIRETLYPKLQDAPNVSSYPNVVGMKQRLFWFDHAYPENDGNEDGTETTSRSNDFEVEMVTALVSHLIRQGVYKPGEIAVLTPYLGQLFKLRAKLSNVMEVTIDERDLEEAGRKGLTIGLEGDAHDDHAMAKKTPLLQALRVATIDNFQGEEAKVVVISLVRSNDRNRVGFLRTSNRINVLLSRAKHGMYIVGNSTTASKIPMWEQVFELLRTDGCIGPSLELQCDRHPETPISVAMPEDFVIMSPEGGCGKPCDRQLLCGHLCPNKCHSNILHDAVYCLEPCTRDLKGCDHGCPQICGDPCVKQCGVRLKDQVLTLPCNHQIVNPACWQNQAPEEVTCREVVDKKVPNCGHVVQVQCHVDVADIDYTCRSKCQGMLPCGHACETSCSQCRPRSVEDNQAEVRHGRCKQICGRKPVSCGHACSLSCHEGPCPPCKDKCGVACAHSACGRKCAESCVPCTEDVCQSRCPHSSCTLLCAAPCNWIPCERRCTKYLSCGHQCPSLCGELCPSPEFCQSCGSDQNKSQIVDGIKKKPYAEVTLGEMGCIFPPCGHILDVHTMDDLVGMKEFYEMDADGKIEALKVKDFSIIHKIPVCPQCQGSLRKINRYGRIVREVLLTESTKKLIASSDAQFVPLAQLTQVHRQKLLTTKAEAKKHFSALPEIKLDLDGAMMHQINMIVKLIATSRYKELSDACQMIVKYTNSVAPEEQSLRRIWDVLRSKQNEGNAGTPCDEASKILQTRQHMMGFSLLIRCHLAILSDFISHIKASGGSRLDLTNSRAQCEELAAAAIRGSQPTLQVEALVYLSRYLAIGHFFLKKTTTNLQSPERIKATRLRLEAFKQEALSKIEQAKTICHDFSGPTGHLTREIEQVEEMIKKSVVHDIAASQEMKDIYDAMSRKIKSTGCWCRCKNGHLFIVDEDGLMMRCPQCDSTVDGRSEQDVKDITTDLDKDIEK